MKTKARGDSGFFTPAFIRQHSPLRPTATSRRHRVLTNTRHPTEVIAMHPSVQQRVDGVAALHIRSTIATAAFYALIGKESPVQKIRYQVVAKGEHAYHITELATGKVRAFRFTYKEAVNFAQQLESRADGIKVTLSGERS